MPQYRRARVEGGCFFLTLVTYKRRALFASAEAVGVVREALRAVQGERPFVVQAAVIMPDHLHFLWKLPTADGDFSKRVGRFKVEVTRALKAGWARPTVSSSRERHRESAVWQRRFWEHTIRDEDDWRRHMDYIHYNPVHHGLVKCPHEWPFSSFSRWVERKGYEKNWCCRCRGAEIVAPDFAAVGDAGE